MKRYLLDTHILVWLLTKNNRLNKNVREDIEYFQHLFYVSVESLREIVILQSLNKIILNDTVDEIAEKLDEHQIEIIPIEINHVKTLAALPVLVNHNDPFDKMLIAQSITNQYTLISNDIKFSLYKDFGLRLRINEI
ncbi:MAG: type II toxin-antitoxin system VapC family toxin [Prevotellaceae bacterium]|jgi:PIN domain nuclease of toxin-antitoxin system|nr:type II toxin-antitoxin system VapC family toxin [Prevotellaceae bacterium]